jgi:carbon storage regulator
MLVLSRREGERITIGEGITITVVRIDSHGVRIGVEAPREIPIIRSELLERNQGVQHTQQGERSFRVSSS